MDVFKGYHSEWNLGSPGGWDYQRMTQEIAKVVWHRINTVKPTGVDLDFDHPMLYPVVSFTEMLLLQALGRESTALQTRIVDAVMVTIMEHGLVPPYPEATPAITDPAP